MLIRSEEWRLKKRVVDIDEKKLVPFDFFAMMVKVHRRTYNRALVEEKNYTETEQLYPISTESLSDEIEFSRILHRFLSEVGIIRFDDDKIDAILSNCRAMTTIDAISCSTTAVPVLEIHISVLTKPY